MTLDSESLTAFPSSHQLRAALRAGDVVQRHAGNGRRELTQALARTPTEAVFSEPDLLRGAYLLEEARFVTFANEVVKPDDLAELLAMPEHEACEFIIERLLLGRRPLWITAAATKVGVTHELIPEDAARGLGEIFPDLDRREAFLLDMGRRFSADELRHVGDLAEDHVVACAVRELNDGGRPDLASLVQRLSLRSDQLGYDVKAPREGGEARRLEVKGTRSQGSTVAIYLSRKEAHIALQDPDWFIVLCRVRRDESVELVGWTTGESLRDRLPTDPETGGAWQSTEIYIDAAELMEGLPPWRSSPHDH